MGEPGRGVDPAKKEKGKIGIGQGVLTVTCIDLNGRYHYWSFETPTRGRIIPPLDTIRHQNQYDVYQYDINITSISHRYRYDIYQYDINMTSISHQYQYDIYQYDINMTSISHHYQYDIYPYDIYQYDINMTS
ncbi:MAG: hypothetical protein ACKPKO_62735, partial [Candidatus Fonsibacter sp.]